jgi:hypothetical protein
MGNYYFVYLVLSLMFQPNFKKKSDFSAAVQKNVLLNSAICPFIALGSKKWTTHFPSMDLNHCI